MAKQYLVTEEKDGRCLIFDKPDEAKAESIKIHNRIFVTEVTVVATGNVFTE